MSDAVQSPRIWNSDLESIPEGAVITSARWHVPELYWEGEAYGSKREALAAAIEKRKTIPGAHVTIDLRWKMDYPTGGGIDLIATRTTYPSVASAQHFLGLIDRYTPAENDGTTKES